MRNSTLLYGRGLLGIAFGSKSKLESLIESLTRISFRVFCVSRGLLVAYGKKSLEEIFIESCWRKK